MVDARKANLRDPPQLRFEDISSGGVVKLYFTEDMVLPGEAAYQALLNSFATGTMTFTDSRNLMDEI